MKRLILVTVALLGLASLPASSLAQSEPTAASLNNCPIDLTNPSAVQAQRALNAAKNLARRAAEQANGGLQTYRAERAMHGSVTVETLPCQQIGLETYRFAFRGGSPVAVASDDYSIVSVVRVANGIGSAVEIDLEFNGSLAAYRSYRAAHADQNLPAY
ncbi:MAG: hypothetical protein ACTS3T_21360 [Almyronema sp.]